MRSLLDTQVRAAGTRRQAAATRDHALFRRFPLDGQVQISVGTVPTPYHVYDGHGLVIGGTAELGAVRELLAPEQLHPVQTEAGRALMAVWVCDFRDASLGPHHELQFSVFASSSPLEPVPADRLGLIRLMLGHPEVAMLCHGLWNNTQRVVAYNRELLALDARLADSRIERDARRLAFDFRDRATGAPLLEGCLFDHRRPSLRAGLELVADLGLWRLAVVARQPWLRMPILNPVGPLLGRNAVAESFTKTERNTLRYFDPACDRLRFGDTRYARLGFEPQFFQAMDGFRFVYLSPT
jgi:hypothetical protein